MNEIKLYMRFLGQYSYKGIFVSMGVLSLVPFFIAGITYLANLIAESTQTMGEVNFEMDSIIIGIMLCMGVGAIVKGFEIAMRIRADRKSFIIALGIMAVISSVVVGVWQMILEPLVWITYKQLFEVEITTFSNNLNLLENISLSLCVIMMGVLVGCIYNRLGIKKFIGFTVTSIFLFLFSIWALIYYNEKLVLQVMDQLVEGKSSLLYLIVSVVAFLISSHLLKKASFGNYTQSEGLARKGKISAGSIRIGKF